LPANAKPPDERASKTTIAVSAELAALIARKG
jgi:hypothetical protein